jgi:hypothetical protein
MLHALARPTDDVIETFSIAGEEGYSEFWRRDKSPLAAVELTKLLLALRKICSYVGRNVGNIVWSGMDLRDGIALDPTPIMGKYPIPADKTDIMVGLAVQRAFARTEWSDRFRQLACSQLGLPPQYEYKFNLFFDMCERVYIDCLCNRSVFGYYRERARLWEITENAKNFVQPPTIAELLHLWWRIAADRTGTKHREEFRDKSVGGLTERTTLEKFYTAPIAVLNSIVDRLKNECPAIAGVSERGKFRIELYLSIWPAILDRVKFWPGDRLDPYLLPSELPDEIETDDSEAKALKATLLSYVDQMERALRVNSPDYTEQVRANVKNVDDVVRIEGNDVIMRADRKIDKKLCYDLKLTLQRVCQRRSTFSRGLRSGKIDGRRLHRVYTTGRAFQFRKVRSELSHDFVLLVDATGSMSEPARWDKTERVWMTLFTALNEYRPTRVFAYNEVRNTCRLTEIALGSGYFSVLPHGKTASGEAIIATALTLRGKVRRPFIIHLTDGASNWGCGVKDAIKFCRKEKIRLLTLGISCAPAGKQALRQDYGQLVEFIDDIQQLPPLFRSLLNNSNHAAPA